MSSNRFAVLVAAALLASGLALTGCGKKGPPLPPLRAIPAPATDLSVRQQGERLVVNVAYPSLTQAGQSLPGLAAVELWQLPQPGIKAGGTPPDARRFRSGARKLAEVREPELTAATDGGRLELGVPRPPSAAPEATPPPEESAVYAVRFLSASEEASDFSNLVVLPVATAPPAPVDLRVEGTANGVSVIWTVLESRQIAVYRRPATGRTFGAPLAVVDEAAGSYVDTTAKLGESYAYSVTRVAQAGPTQGSVLVESALAAPIDIAFADRFPPPSPGGLTALKEADRIRLVWQAVSAADLAGYHVFRRTDAGREERLTGMPQSATSFAVPGRTLAGRYVFLVKAIDTNGNESAPAETTVEWP